MIEVIQQAEAHAKKTSVFSGGKAYSYKEILDASEQTAGMLLGSHLDLQEARVAFMVTPGFDYVNVLWGIWRAGGVAVPLCLSHPPPSLRHVLVDTACSSVIASEAYIELLSPLCAELGIPLIIVESLNHSGKSSLPDVATERRAMILYTSGTTNVPKGVVTTHRNLNAQIRTLVNAWRWTDTDHVLCILPLHHVHGIVNVVCCSLWAGARCEFLPGFDKAEVIRIFLQGKVNVFMAVPTIYYKLVAGWENSTASKKHEISSVLRRFRLMVSGSAALPVSIMEKWEEISGHALLERYGMTELGMAISNPYVGPRRAGKVGVALEGVEVRLCDETTNEVAENEPGEIQVSGSNVFLEYWKQPEATRAAFTPDGWFKTGDIAVLEDGYYRILGRSSTDIIKSGGYKISALEIEEVLRRHPCISDCAVVGLEDDEWGEVVGAALVSGEKDLDLVQLTEWMKSQIPAYRVPRRFVRMNELPRNPMGKVTKNDVKKLFAL